MKPNFRTCPQCATRNRLDKEFCVKCGEPLEGIQAGDASSSPKKGKPGIFVSQAGDEAQQSPLVPLVLVLITLGVGFAALQVVRAPEEAAPVAGPTIPKVQPSLPSTSVRSSCGPGQEAYTAGQSALRAGDFQAAVNSFREAVAAANLVDYRLALAEALEKAGNMGGALSEYEAAVGLDGANARNVSEWAKALDRAGRYSDAVRVYETALRLDGNNLANLRAISNVLAKTDNLARARPFREKLVELDPEDLVAKQDLARSLEATNDWAPAIKQYRDVLQAMPAADLSRSSLAEIYMKQNRPNDALAALDEGLKLNLASALLHREKGRVFDRLGRTAEAITEYQQFLKFAAPGAPDTQVFVQRIAELSGSQEK